MNFTPLALIASLHVVSLDRAEVTDEALRPHGEIPSTLALVPKQKFKDPDRHPLRIHWARDGSVAAYVGHREDDKSPVLHRAGAADPEIGDAYDFIDRPVFAKDAPIVAFRVGKTKSKKKEQWWVWLDGEPEHQEDWIGSVAVSPDGTKVAYWAQPGAEIGRGGAYERKPLVLRVVEKKKVRRPTQWDEARALQAPVFTDDSKKVFALGMTDGRWHVVARGKKGDEPLGDGFLSAGDLTVANGGKAHAFSALAELRVSGAIEQNYRAIVDGEAAESAQVRTGQPSLSPDGKRVAWKFVSWQMTMGIAIDDDKCASPGVDYVGRAVWDPKGSRVAFASVTDAGGVDRDALTLRAGLEPREGDWHLGQLTRRKKSMTSERSWQRLRDPVYSPDGELVAARVMTDEGWNLVVFDLEGEVVCEGPTHDEVGVPRFDEKSKSVSYGVRDDRALAWATVTLP